MTWHESFMHAAPSPWPVVLVEVIAADRWGHTSRIQELAAVDFGLMQHAVFAHASCIKSFPATPPHHQGVPPCVPIQSVGSMLQSWGAAGAAARWSVPHAGTAAGGAHCTTVPFARRQGWTTKPRSTRSYAGQDRGLEPYHLAQSEPRGGGEHCRARGHILGSETDRLEQGDPAGRWRNTTRGQST